MREDLDNLYKEKVILRQEITMNQNEAAKYRSQSQRLQNEVNELMEDNQRLSRGLNGNSFLKDSNSMNSGDVANYEKKIQLYKDFVHKRDEKIYFIDKGK